MKNGWQAILAALLLATPTSAATINVMAGGTCPNHPTVLGATCSKTLTCGDAATPCCTWGAATARANALAGADQIVLHQFTEVVTSPAGFPKYPSSVGYPSYFIQTGVASVSPDSGDAYVLDLNDQLENGPVLRGASAGSVYSKGAGSFTITGKKDSADYLQFSGRNPTLYINVDNVTIDGLTILSPNFRDASIAGQVGIRFGNPGNGERAEGGVIKNCRIVGQMNIEIDIEGMMVSCADPGYAIHDNKIINTMVSASASSCTGLVVQTTGCNSGGAPQSGKILWLNNYSEWTGSGCDSRGIFIRESTASVYVGNSRFRNVGSQRGFMYLQDDVPHGTFALEDIHVFNVTVTAAGPSAVIGDDGHSRWPECVGSQPGDPTKIEIVNGLFSGFSQVADLAAGCAAAANTYHPRSTHDRMDHNLCYHASSPDCLRLSGGAPITETASMETTENPGLTATLKLGAGSNAIGVCTNDPLSQGANVCSLTSAGESIDCSKDFEGDQRSGDAWDCGADHYQPDGGGPSCGPGGIEDGGPCDDGDACTTNDICTGGACVGGPRPCDDGNACTHDLCSPMIGCVPTPIVCNDRNPCTDDTCDPASGCVFTNSVAACSDGNACTVGDTCQNGACVSGPLRVCDDASVCTVDSCSVMTGCVHTSSICNDGNSCTTDSCDPVSGCAFTNNTAPCDDGNPCTTGDRCQAGVCTSGPVATCPDDGDVCDGPESCNPGSGRCESGPPASPGTACSDGDACTQADGCDGSGSCVGSSPVVCLASEACHAAATCDPTTGACSSAASPDGTACDDGNACTQGDGCQAGVCTGGPATTCPASDACHAAGTCDPSTGACSNPAGPDGNACDDGDPCTVDDTCGEGICHGGAATGAPPEIQDVTLEADKATVSWSAASTATRYDVARGRIDKLPVGPGDEDESCFEVASGTALVDVSVPEVDTGLWYLARAASACGIGGFGTQSDGTPRVTTTCP